MNYNYSVYYLSDRRDEYFNPRYIGITKYPIEQRLKQHLVTSKTVYRRYVTNWIRSLPESPLITEIETVFCTTEDILKLEKMYILELLSQGYKLTNSLKENHGSTINIGKGDCSQPILVLDRKTGELISEYKSTRECCRVLNLSTGFISSCLTGRKLGSDQYVFVKKVDYNPNKCYIVPEFDKIGFSKKQYLSRKEKMISGCVKANSVCIKQYTRDGTYIGTFSSQHEAVLKLGIQQANISKVLRGLRNHTGGFIFKYCEDIV